MYRDDFNRDITIGRVTLRMRMRDDDSADFSCLGEWCDYKSTHSRPLYSVEADAIRWRDNGIWQDRRGRIVAEPSAERGREYRFILLANTQSDYGQLRYAFQDADRLRALDHGEWCYVGLTADVVIDNRTIGRAGVWGFESDSEDSYLQSEGRSIAKEALEEARQFVESLQKSA